MAFGNPFARDREGTTRNITAYKVATIVSFLVNVVFTIMYTSGAPTDGHHHHTIYGESGRHYNPFTPSYVFASIYWVVLFLAQIGYIWHLFSNNEAYVKSAAAVGSHFILFNLLQFAWVMLWTRAHTVLSELMLAINFFQLCALYFRHSTTPRFVHIPAVTMPLTWTYYALFWNGAVMVGCHGLACRVLANIAVWSFLGYAGFFLLVFKDYTVGFETAFLMAGLGVAQFLRQVIAFQWIFAFTIMATVFVLSLIVAIPGIFGTETGLEAGHQHGVSSDRERAPLLEDA